MIRIIHVLGGLNRGGAETMIMNLYRQIDRTKIQFDFIIHTKNHCDYTDEVLSLGGKIYSFPKFTGNNVLKLRQIWSKFFEDHSEYKILHSHVRSYASLYLPVAKKFGVKTIIHSHSTNNGKGLPAIAKSVLQFPLRFQANYYIGCSKEAGEWLFGKKIVNSNRYYMLKNAVNTHDFKFDEAKRERIRSEFNVSDGQLLIGTVGRLTTQKNPQGIIEICKALKETIGTKFKFVWVGTGSFKEKIESEIKNFGLEDTVILAGVRSDVPEIMMGMDIFILPSLFEGLPVVAVEAQASGLPCLLSDTITKDIAISNLVCYLPINGDYSEWVNLISQGGLKRVDVTQNIIDSGFDIKTSAEWIEDFYRGIISMK